MKRCLQMQLERACFGLDFLGSVPRFYARVDITRIGQWSSRVHGSARFKTTHGCFFFGYSLVIHETFSINIQCHLCKTINEHISLPLKTFYNLAL